MMWVNIVLDWFNSKKAFSLFFFANLLKIDFEFEGVGFHSEKISSLNGISEKQIFVRIKTISFNFLS